MQRQTCTIQMYIVCASLQKKDTACTFKEAKEYTMAPCPSSTVQIANFLQPDHLRQPFAKEELPLQSKLGSSRGEIHSVHYMAQVNELTTSRSGLDNERLSYRLLGLL